MRIVLVAFIIFLLNSNFGFAADEESIVSIYNGSIQYKIKTGKQSPGLYRRKKDSWVPIVNGQVLYEGNKGPLVYQLPINNIDGRSGVVAVIDGKIYLATVESSADNPLSILELGSDQAPLFEIGSSQRRFLPPVTHHEDISVFVDDKLVSDGSNQVTQLVLISTRFNQFPAFSEGMTFAFEILPSRGVSHIQLKGKPIVIDYKFHERSDLASLVGYNDKNRKVLYSELLVHSLEGIDHEHYGKHHGDWVSKSIAELINKFIIPSERRDLNDKLVYDLSTQKLIRDISILRRFDDNHVSSIFEQKYDTITKKAELQINGLPPIEGIIDYEVLDTTDLSNESEPLIFTENQSDFEYLNSKKTREYKVISVTPFSMNQGSFKGHVEILSTYRAVSHEQVVDLFNMPLENVARFNKDEDFSFKTLSQVNSLTGETEVAMIYSYRFLFKDGKKNEQTDYIKFKLVLSDSRMYLFQISSPRVLMTYFLEEDQLNERIKEIGGEKKILTFDNITPVQKDYWGYKQSYDPSKPHFSLFEETYRFNKPSSILSFNAKMHYAEFGKIKEVKDISGLFFNVTSDGIQGNEEGVIPGQLLLDPRKEIPKEKIEMTSSLYVLASKNLHNLPPASGVFDKKSLPDIKDYNVGSIQLFAIDSTRNNGNGGNFKFVLVTNIGKLSSPSDNQSKDPFSKLFYTEFKNTVPFELSSLVDAFFIQGKDQFQNQVTLVATFQNPKDDSLSSYFLTVELGTFSPSSNLKFIPIPNNVFQSDEIKDKLIYDERGGPYLVLTPNLLEESYQYAVLDFVKNQKMFPNQIGSGKNKIKFTKSNESVEGLELNKVLLSSQDSWKVFPMDVSLAARHLGLSSSLSQFDSFKKLGREIDEIVALKSPFSRKIIVVPESLKNLVWDYYLSKYYPFSSPNQRVNQGPRDDFHVENRNLSLYIFDPKKHKQDQVYANLEQMNMEQRKGKIKAFLLAKMEDLISADRPESRGETFKINDVVGTDGTGLVDVGAHSVQITPHILYLLSSQTPMAINEFRLKRPDPTVSMVIVATPEEMNKIQASASSEIDSGLLESFQMEEIKNPDQASMTDSLMNIFKSNEVQLLDYQFSATEIKSGVELDQEQSFKVVLDYAVSRFLSLVAQKKESLFESFILFRSALSSAILTDRQIKKTRIINKFFIERVMTQVFDIPMNLETLDEEDPLRILNRPDAPLKLQEAGYNGPFDLKARLINTILSQTFTDAGKPIPSSMILFGDQGTGKTHLFRSLAAMLKLKYYDFHNSVRNNDANAIVIDAGKITEDGKGMSSKEAIGHLDSFLALPNGYRGFILIDDIHACPNKAKANLMTWIRGKIQSEGGKYQVEVTNAGEKIVVKRPIRNLNLFITLNRTSNQQEIKKFAKNPDNPTLEEILTATLSSPDLTIEKSLFSRIGSLINLDVMPAGAKGPELIRALSKATQSLLDTHNRMALIDSRVISGLVESNPKLDARNFLASSTNSLVQAASKSDISGHFVLVVPSTTRKEVRSTIDPSDDIARWINLNTRIISVDSNLEGSLLFLQMIVDSFRIPIYEMVIRALQENPKVSSDPLNVKALLNPVLSAISDHLTERPKVSIKEIARSAAEFNLNTPQERSLFKNVVLRLSGSGEDFFPIHWGEPDVTQFSNFQDYIEFSDKMSSYSRSSILTEETDKNLLIVTNHLKRILKVSEIDPLPQSSNWLESLFNQNDDSSFHKEMGRQLVQSLLVFLPKICSSDLQECRGINPKELSVYGAARLYLYSLDRAIFSLPWPKINSFLLEAIKKVTQDQVLSQNPGVQKILFGDPLRLTKPITPDLAFQLIESTSSVSQISKSSRDLMRSQFTSDCEFYLTPNREGEP